MSKLIMVLTMTLVMSSTEINAQQNNNNFYHQTGGFFMYDSEIRVEDIDERLLVGYVRSVDEMNRLVKEYELKLNTNNYEDFQDVLDEQLVFQNRIDRLLDKENLSHDDFIIIQGLSSTNPKLRERINNIRKTIRN